MATALPISRERALLFRITHIQNLPWLLRNGLHVASGRRNPDFVPIGNPDLIGSRKRRAVPIPPGGILDDYVPFYFTPYSPMLLNILTGWGDLQSRNREEIVFVISSIAKLQEHGAECILTDSHALSREAQFSPSPAGLDRIDWDLLRRGSLKRDQNDPGRLARYQAEALVHRHVPVSALVGFAGATGEVIQKIRSLAANADIILPVAERLGWYPR